MDRHVGDRYSGIRRSHTGHDEGNTSKEKSDLMPDRGHRSLYLAFEGRASTASVTYYSAEKAVRNKVQQIRSCLTPRGHTQDAYDVMTRHCTTATNSNLQSHLHVGQGELEGHVLYPQQGIVGGCDEKPLIVSCSLRLGSLDGTTRQNVYNRPKHARSAGNLRRDVIDV